MFIRILPTTLLQIFCENLLYFQVIYKSMKIADNTFLENSECEWVNTRIKSSSPGPSILSIRAFEGRLCLALRLRQKTNTPTMTMMRTRRRIKTARTTCPPFPPGKNENNSYRKHLLLTVDLLRALTVPVQGLSQDPSSLSFLDRQFSENLLFGQAKISMKNSLFLFPGVCRKMIIR